MEQTIIEFKDITKHFPGVVALKSVSFSIAKGTVHALVGENGAGKSTLMNILGGQFTPDSGSVYLDGNPVLIKNPVLVFVEIFLHVFKISFL